MPFPGGSDFHFWRHPTPRPAVDALTQSCGGHGEVIRRLGEGLGEIAPPHIGRVEAQLLRRLVDLALHGEARLRCAVPALGPAGGLVGEDARALELVGGNLVRDGLQCAGVEGGGHAVGAIGSAIEPGAEMHPVCAVTPKPSSPTYTDAPRDPRRLPRGEAIFTRPGERTAGRRRCVGQGVDLPPKPRPPRRHSGLRLGHVRFCQSRCT